MKQSIVIHVETPGGETILSGDIKFHHDDRTGNVYATLAADHGPEMYAYAATEIEALEKLADNLEKIARRIREKAGDL